MRHLGLLFVVAPWAAAAAPIQLAHQGRLLDGTGAALNGTHNVAIKLYDGAGPSAAVRWDQSFVLNVDDGYYAVVLGLDASGDPVDSAWFATNTWIGVSIDGGTEQSPRTALVQVPSAGWAATATTATTADLASVASKGERIDVVSTAQTGACSDSGRIVWDTTQNRLRVCAGGSWRQLGNVDPGLTTFSTYRGWADGTFATSCNAYRSPSDGHTYTGATGSGVYRIDPDGSNSIAPYDVFCDQDTDGGGWTLLLRIPGGTNVTGLEYGSALWTNSTESGTLPTALVSMGTASNYASPARGHLTVNQIIIRDETDAATRSARRTLWSDLKVAYRTPLTSWFSVAADTAVNKSCIGTNRVDNNSANGRWAMFQESNTGSLADATQWGLWVHRSNDNGAGRLSSFNCGSTQTTEWPAFGAKNGTTSSGGLQCNLSGVTQGGFSMKRDTAADTTVVAANTCTTAVTATVWTIWVK
jgi:hypothetical protein